MKLSNLNEWFALTANVGVLIGLIVLIYEINQNTKIAEVSAYQDLSNQINHVNELRVTSEEITSIQYRGLTGEELPEMDRIRFESYWRIQIRLGVMAFVHFENGFIGEDELLGMLGPVRTNLQSDRGKDIWVRQQSNLSEEFVAYTTQMMVNRFPEDEFWRSQNAN